ncbi:MAG: SAM-dependent methyltransferase [Candidatus Thermofonsia Clade 1 bacterium]|uniref:SAM-dependent methyltransferase n=2 Tax=Candidatus Thermofonsia Clade 1 bacterium TaxID=2364210 RepID=A0A2M8P2P7_9CHLR|nr:MAG: SAM-dependent methyltransferase [Candidatus Thermofonsia Clade 1 bacterium]
MDIYVCLAHALLLSQPEALVVDIGFGAYPYTTLEMAARWRAHNPTLRVLGVEIDPERVRAAQPYAAPPQLTFALGGFNLADVIGVGAATIIRCYNVLRQYAESEVAPALQTLSRALRESGLLIEGTSTPNGSLAVFETYVKRNGALCHVGLVFATNFRQPDLPAAFQTVLPKRLIHHMRDAAPFAFFRAWQHAYALAQGKGIRSRRKQWIAAAEWLIERGAFSIDRRKRLIERGYLCLRTPLL